MTILSRFFRDNAPEDVWVSVKMPGRNINLWVPEETRKALVKNLQENTESVPSGLPKGWGLVGPPPPVLILCFQGPQYAVELYLEGDGRYPCIGAFQHYTVRNAPLAKTLASLMEEEENRESLGPDSSLLRRWLEGMAEGRFEMPEPTEAELKAMAKEKQRLSYSYEMSKEEMAFLEETEAFLKAGKDINAPGEEEGLTRLHHAAEAGYRTAVEYLLLHGAKVDARTERAWVTPLELASMADERACAILLILAGADVHRKETGRCRTDARPPPVPLNCARLSVAEVLVTAGADVNAKDPFGNTPLFGAWGRGGRELIELLIAHGADLNATNKKGETPLMEAVSYDNLEAARLLLSQGATLDIFSAAALGNTDRVRSVLGEHPDLVNAQAPNGNRPLHFAVWYGQVAVVDLLLKRGANVNAPGFARRTPVYDAVARKDPDMVARLIRHGADVTAKAEAPISTPLHYLAVSFERKDANTVRRLATLLLENGADINARNQEGNTPLHACALRGTTVIAKVLVSLGADVNAKNYAGERPLHFASRNNCLEVVEILVGAGADVNAKTSAGETPLDLARAGNYEELSAFLKSYGARKGSKR